MSTSSDKSSTPTEAGIPVNDLLQQLKVLEQAQDAASIQAVATKLRSLLNVNTSSTQGQGLNPSSERKTEGNQSTQTAQLVYICGDESGVGKTTVCMGLLASALDAGYTAKDLAYIKPCTQCEDVQLLWKWCDAMGIECRGIGPILFRPGYTGMTLLLLHLIARPWVLLSSFPMEFPRPSPINTVLYQYHLSIILVSYHYHLSHSL